MKLYNFVFILINTLLVYYDINASSLKVEEKLYKVSERTNLLQIDKSKTVSFIIESRPNKASLINLKNKGAVLGYSFGMSNKEFLITAFVKNTLKIDNTDDHKIVFGGRSISLPSLSLTNNFKYLQQRQWKMVLHDSFNLNNTVYNGWDYGVITKCGSYYNIFGGNCQLASTEIKKDILELPPHRMIRIEVYYHFIGNWQGETGYLKLNGASKKDMKYLWTYRCSKKKGKRNVINKTCGYEVCLIDYPVSVTIQHSEPRLSLSLGSTLSNNLPCDRSYGISDFRIYIQ